MQTCSPSNKVGLFAEILPRLFPVEIVVRKLKPDWLREGGVVLLGAFLLFAPVMLCSWHSFMVCGCFLSSLFSLSCKRDKHAPCIPLCNGMLRIWELCRQCENRSIMLASFAKAEKNSYIKSRKRCSLMLFSGSAEVKLAVLILYLMILRHIHVTPHFGWCLIFHKFQKQNHVLFWLMCAFWWLWKGVWQGLHMGVVCCGCEQRTKSQEVGIACSQLYGCVCLVPHVTADLDSITSMVPLFNLRYSSGK